MIRIASIAILLAACGDPGNKCPERGGTEVSFGTACVFAPRTIAIDGDLSDWSGIPSDMPVIGGNAGDVQGVHSTLTPDGNLAMYIETVAAPLELVTTRYRVELYPLDGPAYTLALDLQPTASIVELGTNTLGGFPLAAAFGPTGIELAMPISALPFGGGLAIETAVVQRRAGSWGVAQSAVPQIVYVCWDPHSPLCQPSYTPPT